MNTRMMIAYGDLNNSTELAIGNEFTQVQGEDIGYVWCNMPNACDPLILVGPRDDWKNSWRIILQMQDGRQPKLLRMAYKHR